MGQSVNAAIRAKIINEARSDRRECGRRCYDFGLYHNSQTNGFFVRYTKNQYDESVDYITETYRWICFDTEGVRTDCDPIFDSIKDENTFYKAMTLIENFTI